MDKHICLSLVSLGAALCCGIIPYSKSQVVADVVDDQVFVVDMPNVKGVYNTSTGFSGTYTYPAPEFQDNPRINEVVLDSWGSFIFFNGYAFWVSSFDMVGNQMTSLTMCTVEISSLSQVDDGIILDSYILADYCPSVFGFYYNAFSGSSTNAYLNGNLAVFVQPNDAKVVFDGGSYVELTNLTGSITGYPFDTLMYDINRGIQPFLNDVYRSFDQVRAMYEYNLRSYGESEFNRGRIQGYNEGRNSVSDESASIITLFGAVANVPISILNGMGQFVVWDVSIISILATFLVIAMFAWVIRKVI